MSPDGTHFLIISHRGDLELDREITSLDVYSLQRIRSDLRQHRAYSAPSFHVERVGGPRGENGIVEPRWTAGGDGVSFRGTVDSDVHQDLYSAVYQGFYLNVLTGGLSQVTNVEGGIGWFTSRGDRSISTALAIQTSPRLQRYPMEPVYRLPDGSVNADGAQGLSASLDAFTSTLTSPHPIRIAAIQGGVVSPNGRLAAVQTITSFEVRDFSGPQEAVLARVDSVNNRRIVAPGLPIEGRISWISNTEVLFVGLKSPGTQGTSISTYDIGSGRWTVIYTLAEGERLENATWDEAHEALDVHLSNSGRQRELRVGKHDSGWAQLPLQASRQSQETFDVRVLQSENDPPRLVATESGRQISLDEPDPALRHVRLLPVRQFRWQDPDGTQQEASLVLPANFRLGHPVPVVISNYYYLPELFLPDGSGRGTSEAAQALAARGIGSLTIRAVWYPMPQPTEGPQIVARIDAVVDELVRQGIGSSDRIAITGFSRGGYHSFYANTHPVRTALAAMVSADGFTMDYAAALRDMAASPSELRGYMGGRMLWDAPADWLEHDPSFNIDRVTAPALFTQHMFAVLNHDRSVTDYGEIGALATMGPFLENHRPVDYVLFTRGIHQLANPVERVAIMSLVVDWCAFWLLHEEDPAPDKAEQYARWRQLYQNWHEFQNSPSSTVPPGFIPTRIGLSYRITDRMVGTPAAPGDTVVVNYVVKDTEGRIIADSRQSHPLVANLGPVEPETIPSTAVTADRDPRPRNGLGRGWDVGLRVLHQGERATFLMPARLALGIPGLDAMGPDARLSFEIEVAEIRRARPS